MAYTLLVWDNVCCFLSATQEELAVKQILKVAAKSEGSGMRMYVLAMNRGFVILSFGISIMLQKCPQHSCVCVSVYNSDIDTEQ